MAPADAAEVEIVRPRQRVIGLEPDQPVFRLLVAVEGIDPQQLA